MNVCNLNLSGIPSLIILDEDNKVITTNGRAAVGSDAEGKVSHVTTLKEIND